MKCIIGIIVMASSMASVYCGSCLMESDCQSDECCAALSGSSLKRGMCMKLGKKRDSCNMPEEKLVKHGGKYLRGCPCSAGYSCEAAIGMKELFIGPLAIFVLKCHKDSHSQVTPQTNPEKSGTDSGSAEGEIIYEEIIDGGEVVDEEKIADILDKEPAYDKKSH